MIGFVVRFEILKALCNEDGTWNDDRFIPETTDERFFSNFSDAFNEYLSHFETHKNHSWYPGYIHDSENNKVFFRVVHEGKYNRWVYKTTLQIEQCFYDKKDAG